MAKKGSEANIWSKIIAVWFGLGGALGVLAGLVILVAGAAFTKVLSDAATSAVPVGMLAGIAGVIGIVALVFGIIGLAIAWGLWNLKNWARIVASVLCVLGLFSFPVGTVINALMLYAMWFHEETKALYK